MKRVLQWLLLSFFAIGLNQPASAYIYNFGWTNAPASVGAGQDYTISASAYFEYDYWYWYGGYGTINLYRNSSWVTGASASYYVEAGQVFNDGSGQVIGYSADASDDAGNWEPLGEHYVTIAGYRPQATISVDGYSSGATIVRPAGGSVSVTVRYRATDADGNLSGIRPQIWYPAGDLNNNGGNFVPQSGSSGDVVWTVTLNQNGHWRFWTDAQDADLAATGDYVNSGPWGSGFLLNVVEQQADPNVNFTVSKTTMYVGETIMLTSAASDGNSDLAFHSFWWDQGLGYAWTSPQFAWNFEPNDAGWSNISNWNGSIGNAAGQTITANWTAFAPGTYYFHSNAYDSRGAWGNGAVHVVTVINRPPSVSYTIIDASTGAHLTPVNGKVTVGPYTSFLVQVIGSDPDGRLARLYVRMTNPAGQQVNWLDVPASGSTMGHNFHGFNTGFAPGKWEIWAHARDADSIEWGATPDFNGNNYGWATNDSVDLVVDAVPSNLTLSGVPSTSIQGNSFTIYSSAHDSDGDLTAHMFWRRGSRGEDNFDEDWNGWQNYHENSSHWSNWSNPGQPSHPRDSNISATFTPPSPGYWQFHANAGDVHGLWSGGATSGPAFVAPVPSATITASVNGGNASGGGSLTIYTGQAVTISSTATAGGWLSEHNIYGYINNDPSNFFSPVSGGAWLPGADYSNSSSRTITWTPTSAGTYTLYTEAFTGRQPGERIGGTSGYPTYYDGNPNKRITFTVKNPEASSITNSSPGYGADGFEVYINNVSGAVGIACPTWTAANGQDDLNGGWETHGYEAVHEPAHNRWKFAVYRSAHFKEYGVYVVHLYARNALGHLSWLGNVEVNLQPPKIDAVTPSRGVNVNGLPYKVYVTGAVGVARMYFPTWTEANGQDDLRPVWWEGSDYEGIFDAANNRWEFTVNRAAHNDEFGLYHTHVWGVDSLGDWVMSPLGGTSVTMTNALPTVQITVLDGARNAIPVFNNRAGVRVNTTYYLRVSGTDSESRLGKLYIRAAANGTSFIEEDVTVSGGAASHDFGPYTAPATAQEINVWGHTLDADGAMVDANLPDIEVIDNYRPVGNIDNLGQSGYTLSPSGWALDREDGANIKGVSVFLNGAGIGSVTRGFSRADVASHAINILGYPGPESRFTLSGWTFSYDLRALSYGTHYINFLAKDQNDQVASIGQRNFTVSSGNLFADTDNDGVPDAVERAAGLDPNNPNDIPARSTETFTHDALNRLRTGPGGNYTYDKEGNINPSAP